MKGYVARKGDRFYAVIYEGHRSDHRGGTATLASGGTDLARRRAARHVSSPNGGAATAATSEPVSRSPST